MKKIAYLLSVGALFSLLTFFGCGDDDGGEVDPVQEQINRLAKTWNATLVTYQTSEDRSTDYANFSLTFNGSAKTYSANDPDNNPGPFEEFSSGDWDFGGTTDDPILNNVLLDPSVTAPLSLTIQELTDTRLRITFIYTQGQAGRLKKVDGTWDMTFEAAN